MGLEKWVLNLRNVELLKLINNAAQTSRHIYAIGDIVPGPQLAHKASYEAKIAAEAISGQKSEVDYLAIPAVCFTDPELATVGLNEQQAKDEGYRSISGKFPFAANGRALALDATEGFVKLVARKEDGLFLEHKSLEKTLQT